MGEYERTLSMDPDPELARVTWQAIESLDSFQMHQVLLRAAEDTLFRAHLHTNLADALSRYGYRLSEMALEMLRSTELDSPDEGPALTYH